MEINYKGFLKLKWGSNILDLVESNRNKIIIDMHLKMIHHVKYFM